jgi:hypothetical protein
MNKTQRKEKSVQRAIGIAIDALERIEKHEKECGERWAEAVSEMKQLRVASDAHSARWEKLAWLVVGTVIATAITHLIGIFV